MHVDVRGLDVSPVKTAGAEGMTTDAVGPLALLSILKIRIWLVSSEYARDVLEQII